MPEEAQERYCPTCGLTTTAEFCPDDGMTTVIRKRLDADATAVHEGDIVAGRYRVADVLGRGGFGAVYRAEHTGTRQQIALKMMLSGDSGGDDEEVRRFFREAQVTASLRHPNTVRVFDVGQTDKGALFIAMEMLRGPTLEGRLRELGAEGRVMAEKQAIAIGIPILRSLAEAHNKGLVHRDLKPANVMLTRVDEHADDDDDDDDDEMVVKVLDFGIARPSESSLTGAGTALGTPAYMSPEQCTGGELDGRSDLYALGVILFRAVAGRAPFADSNPLTLMFRHASAPPPDLASAAPQRLSDGFCECVMRALSKEPCERWESARQMRKALEAARDGVAFAASTSRYRNTSSTGIRAVVAEPDSDRLTNSGTVAFGVGGRHTQAGADDGATVAIDAAGESDHTVAGSTVERQRRSTAQIYVDDLEEDAPTAAISLPEEAPTTAPAIAAEPSRSAALLLEQRPQRSTASRSRMLMVATAIALAVAVAAVVWSSSGEADSSAVPVAAAAAAVDSMRAGPAVAPPGPDAGAGAAAPGAAPDKPAAAEADGTGVASTAGDSPDAGALGAPDVAAPSSAAAVQPPTVLQAPAAAAKQSETTRRKRVRVKRAEAKPVAKPPAPRPKPSSRNFVDDNEPTKKKANRNFVD